MMETSSVLTTASHMPLGVFLSLSALCCPTRLKVITPSSTVPSTIIIVLKAIETTTLRRKRDAAKDIQCLQPKLLKSLFYRNLDFSLLRFFYFSTS